MSHAQGRCDVVIVEQLLTSADRLQIIIVRSGCNALDRFDDLIEVHGCLPLSCLEGLGAAPCWVWLFGKPDGLDRPQGCFIIPDNSLRIHDH